jgi:hypothetical protein
MMAVQLKSVAQIRSMSRKSMIAGIQMNSRIVLDAPSTATRPAQSLPFGASSPRHPAPVVACEFPALPAKPTFANIVPKM